MFNGKLSPSDGRYFQGVHYFQGVQVYGEVYGQKFTGQLTTIEHDGGAWGVGIDLDRPVVIFGEERKGIYMSVNNEGKSVMDRGDFMAFPESTT